MSVSNPPPRYTSCHMFCRHTADDGNWGEKQDETYRKAELPLRVVASTERWAAESGLRSASSSVPPLHSVFPTHQSAEPCNTFNIFIFYMIYTFSQKQWVQSWEPLSREVRKCWWTSNTLLVLIFSWDLLTVRWIEYMGVLYMILYCDIMTSNSNNRAWKSEKSVLITQCKKQLSVCVIHFRFEWRSAEHEALRSSDRKGRNACS